MARPRKPRPDTNDKKPEVGRIFARKVVSLPLGKYAVLGKIFYSQSEALAYAERLQDID